MLKIEPYLDRIKSLCEKYEVKKLTLFGSALTKEFQKNSDVDFLLELSHSTNGLHRYMALKSELELILKRPVDLLMPDAIKNARLKQNIYNKTRELYAA